MKQFEKQYQNEPVDFHLWSQTKIAAFWWRAALEWVLSLKELDHTDIFYVINPILIKKELQNE